MKKRLADYIMGLVQTILHWPFYCGTMYDDAVDAKVGFWVGVGSMRLQVCWRPVLWHISREGRSQNWEWRLVFGAFAIGKV